MEGAFKCMYSKYYFIKRKEKRPALDRLKD